VPLDFRATNLVYAAGGPVLVDPDNAEYAPRILDLALAVLLFHYESDTAPGRLFTGVEWVAFRDAYLRNVRLTRAERDRWPDALRYMFMEWGVWTLIDCAEWHVPRQRAFLSDLVRRVADRFPLGRPATSDSSLSATGTGA
jgi:spectinomycin phosphotransferase